ncbi:GNAT family N-acetyltransferase [Pelagibius sp. CAU 1746]|uniref:GNAT family N-acetyltransferase n=1 Tax=Pelagibius sp. CAU 1746 TaxID=3140370 RepID=UPI00325AE170
MTLTFRQMIPGDIPAALDVRFSTVENAITLEELDRGYGITPASLAASLEADVRGWLCEDGGRAVGFAMADRSNGEIQVVAVRPSHEGRGIGKALLERVTEWLFDNGYSEIWLGANPDPAVRASGFYKKYGWRRTGVIKRGDEVLKLRKADRVG